MGYVFKCSLRLTNTDSLKAVSVFLCFASLETLFLLLVISNLDYCYLINGGCLVNSQTYQMIKQVRDADTFFDAHVGKVGLCLSICQQGLIK